MRIIRFLIIFLMMSTSVTHANTTIKLKGLQTPVSFYRDSAGIPHIDAKTEKDAYFMMGYLEASDRFFQMDYARHYYEGKLAELLGEERLDSDRAIRQVGLPYYASHSFNALSNQSRLLLQAYSDGVNAFIQYNPLSKDYNKLHLTKKTIAKWTILDSLAITRGVNANVDSLAMPPAINASQIVSFDDIAHTQSYITYLKEGETNGFNGSKLWLDDIYRSSPNTTAITIPHFFERAAYHKNISESYSQNIPNFYSQKLLSLNNMDTGSNIFVVDGKHSTTGFPMMANDSHYSLYSPPLWYLIDLHVSNNKEIIDTHLSVLMPGSFVYKSGYNQQIAWGSTTSHVNISDVYLEHLKLDKEGIPIATHFMKKIIPLTRIQQIYYYNAFTGDTLEKANRNPIKDSIDASAINILKYS